MCVSLLDTVIGRGGGQQFFRALDLVSPKERAAERFNCLLSGEPFNPLVSRVCLRHNQTRLDGLLYKTVLLLIVFFEKFCA